MRVGVAGLVLGLLVVLAAGCSGADPAQVFQTALPQEGDPPLPVVLRDTTGLVRTIGPAADPTGDAITPKLVLDPKDAKVITITWLGGPCESDARLAFSTEGAGYRLQLAASQKGDCPLIGYPRGVRIELTSAIPISSIEVGGRG